MHWPKGIKACLVYCARQVIIVNYGFIESLFYNHQSHEVDWPFDFEEMGSIFVDAFYSFELVDAFYSFK